MIDVVHGAHSPIFDAPRSKKLPPSFYWGVAFAVLLHLILLYCLFQQNFSIGAVESPPEPPATIVEMYTPPVTPPPDPQPAPKNVVVVHNPAAPVPATVPTVPLTPVENAKPDEGPKVPPVISPTVGASSSAAPAEVYVKARWTRFPDSNALADYYPERAANDEVEGSATVECTVLDAAGRVSCRALSEIPGNYGFGKATVRMVQDKGRVDTTQGDVKIGSVLKATIKWTLG